MIQTVDIEPLDLAEYVEGHPQPVISVVGDLLDGLVFTDGIVTGEIVDAGVVTQAFRATNTAGTADVTVTFNVASGIAPTALANFATIQGNEGNDLFYNINDVIADPGTGGYADITITLKDGESLPAGLALTGDGGTHIFGDPTTKGMYATTFIIANRVGSIEVTLNFNIGDPTAPIFKTYNRGIIGGRRIVDIVRRTPSGAATFFATLSFLFNANLNQALAGGRSDVTFEVLFFSSLAGFVEVDRNGVISGSVDIADTGGDLEGHTLQDREYHDIVVKATNPQGSTTATVRIFVVASTFFSNDERYYDDIPELSRIEPVREIDVILRNDDTQYTLQGLYDDELAVSRGDPEWRYPRDSYAILNDPDAIVDRAGSTEDIFASKPILTDNTAYDDVLINIGVGDTHELDVAVFNDFSVGFQRIRLTGEAFAIPEIPATITEIGLLGNAHVGTEFTFSISEFIRGTPEITVTVEDLPAWLNFDAETLEFVGTPIIAGDSNIIVNVSNRFGSDFTHLVIRAEDVCLLYTSPSPRDS